jgi:predicted TIM-barrel fold metal-dependent hydrolase
MKTLTLAALLSLTQASCLFAFELQGLSAAGLRADAGGAPEVPAPAPVTADKPPMQPPPPLTDDSGMSVALDAHIHLSAPERPGALDNVRRLLADNLFQNAFLLSPAYLISLNDQLPAAFADHESQKRAYDLATSSAAGASGGRLRGLCGFDSSWADAASLRATADCFRLPGMKGLKVRMASGFLLADETRYAAVRRAIAAGGPAVKLVLLHLDTYEYTRRDPSRPGFEAWVAQDRAELDAAVRLMKEFPAVQFVIAHSAFGAPMVRHLAQKARIESATNFWIDTSHFIPAMRNAPPMFGQPADPDAFDRNLAGAWRELGIGRVLFGSDIAAGSTPDGQDAYRGSREFIEEKLGVATNSYLSREEKLSILSGNGRRLWELTD